MTPRRPALTIALQTYNRAGVGYLRAALDAILSQTYADFELLVLDNHSTDATTATVLEYHDSRLTYVRQPPGRTPDTNFNTALWMARGDYVLPTHDDDIMEPDMIERMMDFKERHPSLACLATNVSLIDGDGTRLQPRLYNIEADRVFERGAYLPAYLEEKLWLPTPTCMFHRAKTIAVKGAEARATQHVYQPSADIVVSCLLNTRNPIALLAAPLLRYRQHAAQESRNVDQSEPLLAAVTALLKHRKRFASQLPALRAAEARYRAQDLLFEEPEAGALSAPLRKLKNRWEAAVAPAARALDAALPFEILLCQAGLGSTIPANALKTLLRARADSAARRAYRCWAALAQNGAGLFDRRTDIRRIAILGSMLTAHLIALDARRANIDVVACLDSAPARAGKTVFGIPVLQHDDLRRLSPVDAIVLSSERDHELALRAMLRPHLPDAGLPMPSWKELAQQSFEHNGENA